MGRCNDCGEWSTVVEESISFGGQSKGGSSVSKATKLSEVQFENYDRTSTGIDELDIVLGGGLVPGSLILVGGDPGIGKSTLLLQVANMASSDKTVLYVSGEESPSQIKLRANRIGANNGNILLLAENEISSIFQSVKEHSPEILVIDSIQTVYDENITSAQGSVSQVKEITAKLMKLAKRQGVVVFIIGHVTKSGAIAGPKVLEHMVDTVLYFEGEKSSLYRLIRVVKNRFGSTNELGIFEMKDTGLKGVENPSELFISNRPEGEPGSSIVACLEGTRPLLIEVQALTSVTSFPSPRRISLGLDYNRLNILLAVMEKKLGISMASFDVYVNVAGGVTVSETAADLAVIGAIISSYRNRPILNDVVIFGEVGLSGEVRSVPDAEKRIKEAEKLGFKTVIMPKGSLQKINTKSRYSGKIKIYEVQKLSEIIELLF